LADYWLSHVGAGLPDFLMQNTKMATIKQMTTEHANTAKIKQMTITMSIVSIQRAFKISIFIFISYLFVNYLATPCWQARNPVLKSVGLLQI
jgi:flagellar biosynthesis protein FliP